jgi:hypothetical protein
MVQARSPPEWHSSSSWRPSSVVSELTDYLRQLPWVKEVHVRVREEGHVFFGEAFVEVDPKFEYLADQVEAAIHGCIDLDWRLHDMMISPVKSLEQEHVRSRD